MQRLLSGLGLVTLFGVALLVPLVAPTAALAGEIVLKGEVLDAAGEPVANVDVATIWLEGSPAGGVRTGPKGGFELKTQDYGRAVSVFVMNAERTFGAIAIVEPRDLERPVHLTLQHLVHVHGTFTCTDLDAKPAWTNAYLNVMPGRMRVGRSSSEKAEFSFHVPPGMYQLHMYGTDVRAVTRSLDIDEEPELGNAAQEGGVQEMDLGVIDLKATPLAKLYGKRLPPWTVTDANGVSKDVKLEDYEGKWVLIEFWFST